MNKRKFKKDSRILKEMHEGMESLYKAGFIDKRKMQEMDFLCLDPVPDYTPELVKKVRQKSRLSQAVMAKVLRTSLSTVQKWETGEKHPGNQSAVLLHMLDTKGVDVFSFRR